MKSYILFALFFVCMSAFGQEKYTEYCNDRFEYCLSYPESLLDPRPESQNGDGRVFLSKEGKAKITVWGSNSDDAYEPGEDFKKAYTDALKEPKITYKVVKKDWFVVSGYYENGTIFYRKTHWKQGALVTVVLEYPKKERKTWDKHCGKIADSLKLK